MIFGKYDIFGAVGSRDLTVSGCVSVCHLNPWWWSHCAFRNVCNRPIAKRRIPEQRITLLYVSGRVTGHLSSLYCPVLVIWNLRGTKGVRLVESSWNVMARGDAREGKWRGNWRMEWVVSTLHTTSEHGVSSITTADAHTSAASSRLNWRPTADLNGLVRVAERRNLVSARVPSHSTGLYR